MNFTHIMDIVSQVFAAVGVAMEASAQGLISARSGA